MKKYIFFGKNQGKLRGPVSPQSIVTEHFLNALISQLGVSVLKTVFLQWWHIVTVDFTNNSSGTYLLFPGSMLRFILFSKSRIWGPQAAAWRGSQAHCGRRVSPHPLLSHCRPLQVTGLFWPPRRTEGSPAHHGAGRGPGRLLSAVAGAGRHTCAPPQNRSWRFRPASSSVSSVCSDFDAV